MDYLENYMKVSRRFFPSVEIDVETARKRFSEKRKTSIGGSALFEYKKNLNDGIEYTVVTDLVSNERHLFCPRGEIGLKNEELNLVSGVTSLGLFDTDNVYVGKLNPNDDGIRKPVVINGDGEEDAFSRRIGKVEKEADIFAGSKYDTLLGEMAVASMDGGNVIVFDNNNVEMQVSVDDFISLNPSVISSAEEGEAEEVDVKSKYRIIFKTIQNDGSVREWCVTSDSEEDMDEQLEELKKRTDLVEVTGMYSPDEIMEEQDTEESNEDEKTEEVGEPESMGSNPKPLRGFGTEEDFDEEVENEGGEDEGANAGEEENAGFGNSEL